MRLGCVASNFVEFFPTSLVNLHVIEFRASWLNSAAVQRGLCCNIAAHLVCSLINRAVVRCSGVELTRVCCAVMPGTPTSTWTWARCKLVTIACIVLVDGLPWSGAPSRGADARQFVHHDLSRPCVSCIQDYRDASGHNICEIQHVSGFSTCLCA